MVVERGCTSEESLPKIFMPTVQEAPSVQLQGQRTHCKREAKVSRDLRRRAEASLHRVCDLAVTSLGRHLLVEDEIVREQLDESSVAAREVKSQEPSERVRWRGDAQEDSRGERVEDTGDDDCGGRVGVVPGICRGG